MTHRKSPRNETNEEFVVRIMSVGCPTGTLIQPFVMEALARYCMMVMNADMPDNGLISAEAWKKTAAWLMNEINIRHKGNTYEAS